MKNGICALTFLAVLAVCCGRSLGADKAKMTIKVVDDDGVPLGGVSVVVGFELGSTFRGEADTNGFFVAEGVAGSWDARYVLEREHYYMSDGKYVFSAPQKGAWQPWNAVVTAVVRPILNPIPMYAKRVETQIPGTNEYYGFDVEVGDWVSPHGRGERDDIQFKATRSIGGPRDYTLTVEVALTNRGDGLRVVTPIPGSVFGSPREAPTNGYAISSIKTLGCKPDSGYFNVEVRSGEYFVFRTRTVFDANSNVVSRCYGKIPTGFSVGGYLADKIGIRFTYYLNPTPNDRNLEFDPKRNLFRNLKSTERVNMP